MRVLISGILLFLSCLVLKAQVYDSAVGVVLGYPLGVSYKKFVQDKWAVEGITGIYHTNNINGGINVRGLDVALLVEGHTEVPFPDLYIVYGGGGHIGTYDTNLNVGLDAVAGLEYNFRNVPVNMMFMVKPAFGLIGGSFRFIPAGGFVLRYVLN